MITQALFTAGLIWVMLYLWKTLSWCGGVLLEEGWIKGGKVFYLLMQVVVKRFQFFNPHESMKHLVSIIRYLTPSRLLVGYLDRTRFLLAQLK